MAVPCLLTWEGLLLIFGIINVLGFNVDVKMPFIKQGPKNSYFGFSLAQHKINSTEQYLLLVGAPKFAANGSYAPGGVYQCDVNNSPSCSIINNIDTVFAENSLITTDDQWLGGTVRSSGDGIALVCAFRYKLNYNPLGRCASFSNNLQPYREIKQCLDDGRDNEGTSYCQSGADAVVMPDEEIVLGAPGSVDWTGLVSRIYITGDISQSSAVRDKSWSLSQPYHTEDKRPAVDKVSYLGYAVTSGKFRGYQRRVYIGGAPRSNSTGQVVIFTKSNSDLVYYPQNIISGTMAFSAFGSDLAAVDFDNDGYDELVVGCPLYTKTDTTTNMFAGGAIYVYNSKSKLSSFTKPLLITLDMAESECEKMRCLEARFGQSLSRAGDLNLDGYQDLAVGAPYDNFERGAVYIFHGSETGIIPKYVQKITATDVDPALRTFGYSLSGGLDLDRNGYPDVTVGAYASNKAIMLRSRPIVHLFPKVTFTPRKFNLSRPAGCPYDNPALVTKPRYCLQLKICLKFTAKPEQSFSTVQKIDVNVVAEKDRVEKRISFKGSPQPDMFSYTEDLEFQKLEGCEEPVIYLDDNIKDKLTPIQIDIKYSLADSPSRRRRQAVPDSPSRRRRQAVPDINRFPILLIANQTAETSVTSFTEMIDFVKKCGTDDICQSNLRLEMSLYPLERDGNKYVLSIGENDLFKVKITLTNKGEPAYQPSFYLVVPKDMQYAGSTPVYPPGLSPPACININTTTIFCEHTNPFGNSVKSDARTEFNIELDASNLPLNLSDFTIRGLFNTTSQEQSPDNDEVTLPVRMVTKTNIRVFGEAEPGNDVVFRGPIRGASAIKHEDAIGPAVNHTFTVYNEGVGSVGSADLEILWPVEKNPGVYEDGKHLLYLMQTESLDRSKAQCTHDPQYYNVLQVAVKTAVVISNGEGPTYNTPDTRRRREIGNEETQTTTQKPGRDSPSGRNIIKLSCKDKTAKCIRIHCKIFRLDKKESAKIVVRARLWESTLLQDYPNSEVQISSLARVTVSPDLNIFQDTSDDEGTATTYAVPEVKPSVKKELQWWIILVAIAGGIILLVVLILIFWKCGFFKRMKPKDYEPTYQGEIKKTPKDYDNVD